MLSIVIINFNTFATTSECLNSYLNYCRSSKFEVILIDNASTECDPELFKERFPFIKLIKSDSNLGFAGGNNLGIKYSSNDIVLLLNSDTIFIEDCIRPCLNYLITHPNIGVISPKLVYPDLTYQKNARKFKNIKLEIFDLFRPIIKLLPYTFYSRIFLNQYFKGDYDTKCDWLCGAFFMLRKSDLEKLGGKLDDRFFMYGEDQLWCWLFRYYLKLDSFFIANKSVIHIQGGSQSAMFDKKKSLFLIDREVVIYNIRNSGNFFKSSILFKLILLSKYYINFIRWILKLD